MQGTQFLAGSKTYLAAAAMAIYALAGITILPAPYHMTVDAALRLFMVAAGMAGLRSGLTTEVQKLLAAFGVNPQVNASTVKGLEDRALQNIRAFVAQSAGQAGKLATMLALVLLLPAVIMIHACATSVPQTVAQVEVGYTPLATTGAAYCGSAGHDAGLCKTLRELNAAIDVKGEDGQRHGALIAARTAAESGDANSASAALITLNAAIAALSGFELAHGLKK